MEMKNPSALGQRPRGLRASLSVTAESRCAQEGTGTRHTHVHTTCTHMHVCHWASNLPSQSILLHLEEFQGFSLKMQIPLGKAQCLKL